MRTCTFSVNLSFHDLPFRTCRSIVYYSIINSSSGWLLIANQPPIPITGYEEAISYYFILMGLISFFHAVQRLLVSISLPHLTNGLFHLAFYYFKNQPPPSTTKKKKKKKVKISWVILRHVMYRFCIRIKRGILYIYNLFNLSFPFLLFNTQFAYFAAPFQSCAVCKIKIKKLKNL